MQDYKIVDEPKKNKKLFEQNPNPVLIVDSRGKYAGANKAGLDFLETTLDKLTQKKIWDFTPPHKLQKQKKEHKPFLAPRVLETEYYVNGKIKTLMLTVIPYHNENGEILLYGIGYDITAQKENESKLKQSERKFRSLFEDSVDGIYITTPRGKYVNANTALVKMLGYRNKKELMAIDIEKDLYVSANDRPGPDQRNRTFKTRLKSKDGSIIDVEISSRVIYEEGSPKYYQGIVRNITERKKAEEKLKYLSFHDCLTGLYNRAYFDEELNRLDTERQLPLSLIIGDVNSLKLVNDAFGHLEGDKLLKDAAMFLRKYFREEDVVARWGGDEFCMLLPGTSRQDAEKIAARIKDACTKTKSTRKIPISISLGISTKNNNNQKAVNLLKDAEDSMYKSKLIDKSSMFSSIVFSLEKTIHEKSSETKEHAHRLKTNALKLGKALNLSKDRLNELTLLAGLHDIGKVDIPETTLQKKSKLTKDEWEIVKKHPKIGYNIAQSLPQLAHIAEAILHHHEWWDGSGYPQGSKGKDIPLISRIISLADAYDVMRSGRPYKPAIDKKEAIRELKKCSGTQFEPRLVEKFIEILNS
ncbi:MAG: diguanylate cyclase [Actinomycetota bacterium]